MDPFRDDLAAARAPIAELEKKLERMLPMPKTIDVTHATLAATLAGLCAAFLHMPPSQAVRSHADRTSIPARTWGDHLPYEFDDDYRPARDPINCFSGEYECR